jgi:hypothetical protein
MYAIQLRKCIVRALLLDGIRVRSQADIQQSQGILQCFGILETIYRETLTRIRLHPCHFFWAQVFFGERQLPVE